MDKAKGKAKEAFGALSGDEAKKEEGRAQQRKAATEEEATQKEKTSQAKEEARQAERERDRQKQKDGGVLGGVTDSLSGRDRGSRSRQRGCFAKELGQRHICGVCWRRIPRPALCFPDKLTLLRRS